MEKSSRDARSTLSAIAKGNLCHRCGTCAGVCSSSAITLDDNGYPQISAELCTNCMKCVRVCPGLSFDAPRTSGEIGCGSFNVLSTHGSFKAGYLGHAVDADIRSRSCSGGVVTALLVFLFALGLIDGAVVAEEDARSPWKTRGRIARSVKEVLAAAGSKYVVTPLNVVLEEIRRTPGRYAFVGLPCHIQGFRKAAQIMPELNRRVVVTIGLLCHAAFEPELFKQLQQSCSNNGMFKVKRFHYRYGKHSGSPLVEYEDGTMRHALFPSARGYKPNTMEVVNVLFRIFTPRRCLTCFDGTSEFADISAGDPWMRSPAGREFDFTEGFTYILARTERGMKLLKDAAEQDFIRLVPLTDDEAEGCNLRMVHEKKQRALYYLRKYTEQGRPVPDYKFALPVITLGLGMRLHLLSYLFCFFRSGQKVALRLLLSFPGYCGFCLLHLRGLIRRSRQQRA